MFNSAAVEVIAVPPKANVVNAPVEAVVAPIVAPFIVPPVMAAVVMAARSLASAVTNTTATPVRFSNEPVEDCTNVRVSVGPVLEFTPVPISKFTPSSLV
jgi:hypothetical protein